MAKYRKKPVVIEAIQWQCEGEVDNAEELAAWLKAVDHDPDLHLIQVGRDLAIKTLEGTMTARPGDWIIRGVAGELYPCKPDIFAATYEPVDEGDTDETQNHD